MDPVGVNSIETAALGRPFQLGMLYDCRRDALVPGIRLWSKEQLQQNISTKPQINTDFTVTASDSIEEKSRLLNIDECLKLSILGGLVSLSGAANFLKDTKKSFSQQRLTLHYHSTTEFKELIMNHFDSGDMAHLGSDVATHVVTAVLYGADACFVFDREVSSDEDKRVIAGEVNAVFWKLISISAGANINLNDNQKTAGQKFNCTFHGDFQLPSNPTSFEDAMKVFEDLPKLLGQNKEFVVPLRVWLYPLDKLFSRIVKFQHEISTGLSTDIESVIESLSTTEMKCSDLLTDTPASTFTAFHGKINDMKKNCYRCRLSLVKKLGFLLPKIRGKFIEDTALIDLLQEHEESPFERSALERWLEEKEEESDIIKTLLTQLNNSGAMVENKLNTNLMNLEVKHLVSYTFTSLSWTDELLSEQKAFLSPSTTGKNEEKTEHKTWLAPDIQKTMRNNLKVFKNLIDLNGCTSAKFIVTSKDMEDHPGSCILLYENESNEAVCFTPPSKPDCPIIEDVRFTQVVLKVSPPCPATEELKLLYKMKEEEDWRSQTVSKNKNTVTLTDLRPDTEYNIKCAAVGKLNYTVDSDETRLTVINQNLSVTLENVIKSSLIDYGNPALYCLGASTDNLRSEQYRKRTFGERDRNILESHKFDAIINQSVVIEEGIPVHYHLKLTESHDQSEPYKKMTIGERDRNKPHKTILMVGETGTGKTKLINAMINYMLGVQREDKVWFEITDDQSDRTSAHSQTSSITVYGFYLQESPIHLTIIDTPGYGDRISLDKEIAESLLSLSESEEGVHEIDAVCLVIKASQTRLSDRQIYIFDAVQSLFGRDIAENIVLLFTHSRGAIPKNVLTAVEEDKIKCAVNEQKKPVYFLFDNRQSEADDEDDEEDEMLKQSWDLSSREIEHFFKFLDNIKPKTLRMTQDVLQQRRQLEENISKIISNFQETDQKQNELKQTQEALEQHKKVVDENKNFEVEVEVEYKERVDIDPSLASMAMCCTVCEENCHYPGCWRVIPFSQCRVMKDDHCTVCTNKCHYSKHVKEAKIYQTKIKKEKRTYEELKKKYFGKIGEGESLVNKLEEELQELEKEKIKMVFEAFHCVKTLQMIALNADSLITLQHIDFLIEKLKEINEPEKVKTLGNIKKRAGEEKHKALGYIKFF